MSPFVPAPSTVCVIFLFSFPLFCHPCVCAGSCTYIPLSLSSACPSVVVNAASLSTSDTPTFSLIATTSTLTSAYTSTAMTSQGSSSITPFFLLFCFLFLISLPSPTLPHPFSSMQMFVFFLFQKQHPSSSSINY